MSLKPLLLLTSILALTGCWNGENVHVQLGDVSLGQQLVDLKAALDADAISDDVYEDAREKLLAMNYLCENSDSETSWF